MKYPLVRELAVDGVPVTVACRALKIARQPYYRWLTDPVTDAEWREAHLANALALCWPAQRDPAVRQARGTRPARAAQRR
jgi:hypothetical protein